MNPFDLPPDDPLNYAMMQAAGQLLTPVHRGGGLGPAFGSFGSTLARERGRQEDQELVKLKIQAYKRDLNNRVGANDPAAWREWMLVKDLSDKDFLKYLDVKRNNQQVVDVNGVPTVVNRQSQQQNPLSTLEGESMAARIIAQQKEAGKQASQAQYGLLSGTDVNGRPAYTTQFNQLRGLGANPRLVSPADMPSNIQREAPQDLTPAQRANGMTPMELAARERKRPSPYNSRGDLVDTPFGPVPAPGPVLRPAEASKPAIAEDTEKAQARALAANQLPGMDVTLTTLKKETGELLNHPGLGSITGVPGLLPDWVRLPVGKTGKDHADALARHRKLMGGMFEQAYQSLKGAGQIANQESLFMRESLSRVDRATSEEDYKAAVKNYVELYELMVERIKKKAKGEMPMDAPLELPKTLDPTKQKLQKLNDEYFKK